MKEMRYVDLIGEISAKIEDKSSENSASRGTNAREKRKEVLA